MPPKSGYYRQSSMDVLKVLNDICCVSLASPADMAASLQTLQLMCVS